MKKSFSLVELIFVIVILAIIASFAVPKFIGTKDSALVSTLKRDISTIVNSVQTYYLLHKKIDKISDSVTINNSNWNIEDKKITDKNSCISIEVKENSIELSINQDKGAICKKIREAGLDTKSYELY